VVRSVHAEENLLEAVRLCAGGGRASRGCGRLGRRAAVRRPARAGTRVVDQAERELASLEIHARPAAPAHIGLLGMAIDAYDTRRVSAFDHRMKASPAAAEDPPGRGSASGVLAGVLAWRGEPAEVLQPLLACCLGRSGAEPVG
jgi:hypothetical protein